VLKNQINSYFVKGFYFNYYFISCDSNSTTKKLVEKWEQKIVTITLDKEAFSFNDIISRDWKWSIGSYEITIGASVEGIRLT